MAKRTLKMWLVRREVLATDLKQALIKPGRVYSVEEAAKEYQPEIKKPIGFKKK